MAAAVHLCIVRAADHIRIAEDRVAVFRILVMLAPPDVHRDVEIRMISDMVEQCLMVDQTRTGHVDDHGVLLHQGQTARVDETVSLL